MKITTLVENDLYSRQEDLKSQHGLSLHIETADKKILFDTGKDDLFYRNAEILGVDIGGVDYLVLSHAHYDHVGGLAKFLEINKTAKIIISGGAKAEVYSKRLGFYKYIGVKNELLEENIDRFILVDKEFKLDKNISFIINTHSEGEVLKGNSHLYKKTGEIYIPDDFSHEMIMVIEEKKGELVVFTGCSHGGILNMVKSVEDRYPDMRIKGLVGGFHLQNNITKKLAEPEKRVVNIGEKLMGIPHIYTGHCTGKKGFSVLKKILGEQIEEFNTGRVFEIS
ncbi:MULTISPECIES: MBL fold metallo-hydrolase [Psychrilyobacter]|uniref:MBL fold metallo-hydrolase n=1 Tax=Psychrilyobacter piezotolerans TaxID=2293438 RepID=A0ABX9KLG2_9FUSO|nr:MULTISPECIES: MBL fold metallo-hydrolase [Psychrilyobacter]MCS5420398.1 MBL fold metallo-hydrolase [Psychrilyobacter sp. S5]NDI76408.1 MBL fold metallo-hydrolase [Psychrilyobacter piezotolerans]RDE66004.1 MBL fold metallo-hydrolase [Psychrilyobacter sp. S5]REI43182.1 MBL fold metallo-hydrolase [Psychrilyobacter piezotolerans]